MKDEDQLREIYHKIADKMVLSYTDGNEKKYSVGFDDIEISSFKVTMKIARMILDDQQGK